MDSTTIKQRLLGIYKDAEVEVFDSTGDGNHFEISIATSGFSGLSRIAQHKAVMKIFETELKSGEIHAMALKTAIKV